MKKYSAYLTLFLMVFALSCSDDDAISTNDDSTIINETLNPSEPDGSGPLTEIPSDPERVDYPLSSVNDSGVTGTAAFIPNEDGSTTIYIELVDTIENIHPARVNFGSLDNPGAVAVTLNDCECAISETVVTQLDSGTDITFVEMMSFDGNLTILRSTSDSAIVADTNIGANAF